MLFAFLRGVKLDRHALDAKVEVDRADDQRTAPGTRNQRRFTGYLASVGATGRQIAPMTIVGAGDHVGGSASMVASRLARNLRDGDGVAGMFDGIAHGLSRWSRGGCISREQYRHSRPSTVSAKR